MSLELVATIASIGTLLVIGATAVAAFVQLRHLSGSNSISALTESREVLESAEFAAAQRFVSYELPALLTDPAVRQELLTASPLPERLRPIAVVGNFFESLGTFVRHGIIDREIATSLWAGLVVRSWERIGPALAIMRRAYGPALWDQFEYLARISQDWIDRHPDGVYPPGVAHMPLVDVWLEADQHAPRA